jgi:hypothetical protein
VIVPLHDDKRIVSRIFGCHVPGLLGSAASATDVQAFTLT